MNLKHENIHEYVIKCTNTTQITLDDDFNVMDSKPDIDLIVKEWGMAVVNGVRVNQDKAQIDGTLVFAIMYTGSSENDKRFIPVRMDGSLNFLENVNLSCDATGLDVNCKAQLEDLTIKSINSRKISVKAIVALTVTCEEIKNISISTGIEDGDCNAELLLKDFEYVQADVNMKDNLRIKETVSVPNGKADIGSLVWDDVDVRNVNTRMTEDGLSVSGELNVFIMYIADDEAGQVQWYETSTPFTGIIDVSGANPDGISYVGYNVISKNVEVRPDYDGNNRDVAVELVLDMDIKSYEECSRNAMWDMYIPGFDVDIKQETQQLKKLIIRNNNKCRVSGNVKVEDYINLMQIVNATANVQIDSYECIPEGLEIMGAVIVNIFYITSDDNSPMGSINSVIPFTTVVELKEYNKNLIEYTIRPSIEQLQASMNSSAQIEVKAVIALDTICFEPFNINVIDDCECNKRENVDYSALPSMVGYISDGKCTVWDIAKKYDTTGDLMREENSTIQRLVDSDIIPAGTKLLLVRKAMV